MPFWAYMIQCADRSFYVGHTDDLERRIGQHQIGAIPGYTSARPPVHLVWSQEFELRTEARGAELQIKGWSRAKKLALIRGDWSGISALARSKQKKGRASTGSAKPVERGIGPLLFLHPHLSALPVQPFSLEARFARSRLRFILTGPVSALRVPPPATPARRDELWRHTCFELFARTPNGYVEFNLSPSGEWAAYRFSGYREGMAEWETSPPRIQVSRSEHRLDLAAQLQLPDRVQAIGLSAVIEELNGTKSYWALRHPPGDTPDFHHPDCFALEVSPPPAP
jgi:predicted GIY-YIG superfamily endonuclease